MKFLPILPAIAAITLAAHAAEEAPQATPKPPTLLQRLLRPLSSKKSASDAKGGDIQYKNLHMALTLSPASPKLSESHDVKVTVTLANKGGKLVQLEFPTSQRIEVLVKDKTGKRVVQWSEDQAFTSEPTITAVNPGERLEYSATVSTRDLIAGETYTVEAFFPNFDQLRKTAALSPVK